MHHHLAKIVMIIGLAMGLIGGFDSYLWLKGTAEPAPITVAELGQQGSPANVHFTIRDFLPGDFHVIEERNGRWTRVWVPLLKPDGTWPARPVVAFFTGITNAKELEAALEVPALTGVITNGVQSLGRYQQDQFKPGYPNVDLSDALAFQVGRTFPSAALVLPMTLVGLVLFLGGAGVAFGLIRWPR
jgi:hypothetical protein